MGKKKEIMLLITYNCNLSCVYCYEPKTEHNKMTSDQAISYIMEVVNNLDETYSEFEVQFMGGEPLLQFDLIKSVSTWLWEQTFKVKLSHIFIVTNGTLLNDEMKAWFSEHKESICLGLSFDGDRLMQDMNRSESASLVDLSYFVANWPNQHVKMTVSPDTISNLYDGVTYLIEQGFPYMTTDLAMGDRIFWEDCHLNVFAEQLEKLSAFYTANPDTPLFSMFDIDILSVVSTASDAQKHCGCGEDLVCIDTDGKHYACHLFSPIALPKSKVIKSNEYDFSDYAYFELADCKDCAIRNFCPHCYGMNFLCTGDIKKQSAFTCKSARIQFAYACKCQLGRAERFGDEKLYSHLNNIINSIIL